MLFRSAARENLGHRLGLRLRLALGRRNTLTSGCVPPDFYLTLTLDCEGTITARSYRSLVPVNYDCILCTPGQGTAMTYARLRSMPSCRGGQHLVVWGAVLWIYTYS